MDAIKLLKKDHRKVEQLFKQLKQARGSSQKANLRDELAREVLVHAKIEEKCFYPEARKVQEAKDDVKDGLEEHHEVEEQLKQLLRMEPDDDGFDALVDEIQGNIDHHVKDEEEEMFPLLRQHWDEAVFQELGQELTEVKQELMEQDVLMEAVGGGRRKAGGGGRKYASSERTRQELYERAQELDIQGRSKMNKAQLIKAIERAS